MKFFQKLLFVPAVVLVFSACFTDKSESVRLESFLPADIQVVAVIEASDSDQRDQAELLFARFPELNLEENLLKSIVKGEWRVAIGVDIETEELYLVGEFDQPDKVEEFWNLKLKDQPEAADFHMARRGDLFVFVNKEENLEATLARVDGAAGFVPPGEKPEGLAYIYADGALLSTFSVDSEGVIIDSQLAVEDFDGALPEGDLGAKMPGAGLVSYSEFLLGSKGFSGALPLFAEELEVDQDELQRLLEAPFAFAVHNLGLYPGFVFLLQVDETNRDVAEKLDVELDTWVDRMIGEFDRLMEAEGFGVGALQKEVKVVAGAAIHRVHFDFGALPEDILAAAVFVPGLETRDINLSFYYGITGDDVFALAFYPDFEEAYGKDPVSEQEDYLAALDQVSGSGPFGVSYFKTAPLIELFDRWVKMGMDAGFVTEADVVDYQLYVDQFFATINYVVSATDYADGKLITKGYVKID